MMTRRSTLFSLAAAGVLALAVACSSTSGPDQPGVKAADSLHILVLQPNHPPLFSDTVSFMAFKGQGTEQKIYFADEDGMQGEEYLDFKLNDQSLLAYPDGTPFNAGDSVRITIRVINPDSIYFQFEPAGLTFDPNHPAKLNIHYGETGGDFDDDHMVTQADSVIAHILAIWRQPEPSDSFSRLQSVRFEDQEEIEASLTGFSRYAIAY
jgi:hypothetical protein